jgi:Protein of unknown function (DUF3631)
MTTIADDLRTLFRRFVAAGEAEFCVLTLWTLHTHAFGAGHYTPYLAITSAEKQSGKTRVLEVLKSVVRDPQMTASISPAALARLVHEKRPTLLLDELDALLQGDKEMSEALRGILNSGFQADGAFTRMVGVGTAMTAADFSTFCPKAMAGIGNLPDTVADRSITIRLERSPRGACEKFRPRGMGVKNKQFRTELEAIKSRAGAWAAEHKKKLADAEPECPPEFSDRQQDIAEPLLAIADLVGGEWPTLARSALGTLFASKAAEDPSVRVRLLRDIREVFDAEQADKMASDDLVRKLGEIETSPWGEWRLGKAMTARALAKELTPFGIAPRTIRLDDGTKKGYLREALLPVWNLYVTDHVTVCDGSKNAVSSSVYADCDAVTDKKGGAAGGAPRKGLSSCRKCGSFALYRGTAGVQQCQTCEAMQ